MTEESLQTLLFSCCYASVERGWCF